ncbi:hypothetical protein PPTG_22582 [Phytophthora nicotianae INRA-310]|uniref:Reverse transcriptase domain-containing protein n=1 Tax=Phytophthora nicotianae (strain INRA-310) TaxID=761204 RepID=W2QDZ5_PHYN3|nr:hypothetical protein PPTG_22582 [Phytophthora nicotianae INRA-310]ETN11403.1 hypothetical protein PPTG_22582 [Phytophthora nicotianae INRA-310]
MSLLRERRQEHAGRGGSPEEDHLKPTAPAAWKRERTAIRCGGVVCDIAMGDAKPVAQRVRRVAPQFRGKLSGLIKGLLSAKIIRVLSSPWASPIVVIIKKNGVDIRLCIDYRVVNSLTRLMVYPTPLINDLPEDMGKVLWYCSLDMASGFWVVEMTERAPKTPKNAELLPSCLMKLLQMTSVLRALMWLMWCLARSANSTNGSCWNTSDWLAIEHSVVVVSLCILGEVWSVCAHIARKARLGCACHGFSGEAGIPRHKSTEGRMPTGWTSKQQHPSASGRVDIALKININNWLKDACLPLNSYPTCVVLSSPGRPHAGLECGEVNVLGHGAGRVSVGSGGSSVIIYVGGGSVSVGSLSISVVGGSVSISVGGSGGGTLWSAAASTCVSWVVAARVLQGSFSVGCDQGGVFEFGLHRILCG